MKIINDFKSKDDTITNLNSQLDAFKLTKGKDTEVEQVRVRLESELNEMKAKFQSLEQNYAFQIY